jgi:hypothetical protein
MACQVASAIASLHEVLKAGPLCRQRILDPKKISAMAQKERGSDSENFGIRITGFGVVVGKI